VESALALDCATLTVPLDYANPSGAAVQIAVSRRRHTAPDAQFQGVMIMNPGGPGGSGLWMPMVADYFPDDIAAQYDWIGFDPRGVGNSRPALSCQSSYLKPGRPAYVPTKKAIETAWLNRVRAYAASCGRKYSANVLSHMSTNENVDDVESLRTALGQSQINYYGYSYGTYLGQAYATRYPDRVRRMVLDSNVGASGVWEKSNISQDLAFERVLGKFFAWIGSYNRVYHLGTTGSAVRKLWFSTLTSLASHKAGKVIGPAEMTDIFLNAGYLQSNWPQLATMWSAWVHQHKAQPLIDFYGPGDGDNEYASYLATLCTDAPWSRSWSTWRTQTVKTNVHAPFETWGNAWYNAPCAHWSVGAHQPLAVGTAPLTPILLIDGTFDGATPFAGSLETRRRFPTARLIAIRGGTDHAASPDGNLCVDNRIIAYLRHGSTPARVAGNQADVQCSPLPLPLPDELSKKSTTVASRQGRLANPSLADRSVLWRQYVPRF
jgi:pimeloyl-ACP methyl ester carboxylesterase